MLWFNVILGLNLIFLCFGVLIGLEGNVNDGHVEEFKKHIRTRSKSVKIKQQLHRT